MDKHISNNDKSSKTAKTIGEKAKKAKADIKRQYTPVKDNQREIIFKKNGFMVKLTILSSKNESTSENNKGNNIKSKEKIQISAPFSPLTKLTLGSQDDLFKDDIVIKLVYQKVLCLRTSNKTLPGASILCPNKRINCDTDNNETSSSSAGSESDNFPLVMLL